MKRPIGYYIGNSLMIVASATLLYIYLPIILLFILPSAPFNPQTAHGFYISIPKIHAEAPIIANVDPWNESDYLPKLENGVAEAKGFASPGQHGTILLFAHSSDYPWRITRYNIAFYRLPELKKNDLITIFKNGQEFVYTVELIRTVSPGDVSAVVKSRKNQLILQTCTPIGTSLYRLLVFASPTRDLHSR